MNTTHPRTQPGAILAFFLAFLPMMSGPLCAGQPSGAYPNDPKIIALLENLGSNAALVMPVSKEKDKAQSPRHRDYCNKMPYAPDRQTALYAGGSHQTYRGNDVWEYHLGSNRWHQLFAPDGGDHVFVRYTLYFGAVRKWKDNPNAVLTEKEKTEFERTKTWWQENVVLRDGDVTTRKGGPIIPAHTWDAFTYDARARRLLWGMGAGPGGTGFYHAMVTGQSPDKIMAQIDENYTPMWMFDPAAQKWQHYKKKGPRAALRGMGATMEFIPDLGRSIWYVAAQNVIPPAFEMWTFDAVADQWHELKPNGGKSIATLALNDKVAPLSEQQSAYSPKHKKLVAVLKHDTFVYDIVKNEWSKACTDERIDAHDARTVFAYDAAGDVFLLANPTGKTPLAAFSLQTNQWEILQPKGPAMPTGMYVHYRGYYDPVHNVFVVDGGRGRLWVYRYQQKGK
jgi:hypothetical protein